MAQIVATKLDLIFWWVGLVICTAGGLFVSVCAIVLVIDAISRKAGFVPLYLEFLLREKPWNRRGGADG